jgi:hypothetical protein
VLCAASLLVLAACAETRDFPPLDDVKTVTVVLPQAHLRKTIADRERVGALVDYLNNRRAGWKPVSGTYATPLRLKFFDERGKDVAYVLVGTGGIVRSGYFRSSRLDETWKETRRLCQLLGRSDYRRVCGSEQMFGRNL